MLLSVAYIFYPQRSLFCELQITYKQYTIMEIKVLGTGCIGCKTLYANVETAIKELNLDATLVKEEDLMKIMEFNVMTLPALVIDGKVVAKGKLSLAEVKNILSK
jgi:small redox-active disulfide protein 2